MGPYVSVHRSFSLCRCHGCANAQPPLAKLGFAALKLGQTFKQVNDSCWISAAASYGRSETEAGRPLLCSFRLPAGEISQDAAAVVQQLSLICLNVWPSFRAANPNLARGD